MNRFGTTIWGQARALLDQSRKGGWVDLLVLVALAGVFYGIIDLGRQWQGTGARHTEMIIDLSPWALPRYTFFSLCRGLIAYSLSLIFTLVYGYWAAKDRVAEPVLITILDILQSLPVLAFLPGLVLAMVALFPTSNVGLELAAILMIFTGQAWNMTFSFYHSVKAVPDDLNEAATVYGFSWWQRFRGVELPFSMMGLVWNSMMSMAGGWFFLAISETIEFGEEKYRLPGVGSYAAAAAEQQDWGAMFAAVAAMVLMIVMLDQLLWRPVIVWAQKFRVEEGGNQEAMTSWFFNWLRRSHVLGAAAALLDKLRLQGTAHWKRVAPVRPVPRQAARWSGFVSLGFFLLLLGVLAVGAYHLLLLLLDVKLDQWGEIMLAALATLTRVLATVALGTLWALPAGIAIGLSPRLSRVLQPVVQVAASFPAPMLFPAVIFLLNLAGVSLDFGSILLMLMGTQWYILFNVIAGSMAIPADLQEMARSYGIKGWQRRWNLYFPAIFPYLVTGWVTAAGGAWNASIVAEYVIASGDGAGRPGVTMEAFGLGAMITKAIPSKDFALLAASVLTMSVLVVTFNRTVWHRLYQLARTRFALTK